MTSDRPITRERAGALGAALFAYWLSGGAYWVALVCALIGYAVTGGWGFLRAAWLTFPRDFRALRFLINSRRLLTRMGRQRIGVVQLFAETLAARPDATCFLFEDQKWTFRRVDEYSNRVANFLVESGHRPGDAVAIFAESCPEFASLWLGMAKVGVVGALINFNLRSQSFVHCLRAAEATSLVFGSELTPAVQEVAANLAEMRLYCTGFKEEDDNVCITGAQNLDQILAQKSEVLAKERVYRPRSPREKLLYIYTSGTTGLPKAAVISHTRFVMMANTAGQAFGITQNDILYDCLPLYHSAGGVLGVGQAFLRGVTVVVRRKFSASAFWDDCVKYKCTAAQYIGEICRYLLAQPERPNDRRHSVRLMFGNGLRPQIWEEFQRRFGVGQMGEFYGATESNCNIANIDNTIGAVGFLSIIAPWAYPLKLVKLDDDTGLPVRNSKGLCVPAGVNEPGELVGSIVKGDSIRDIDGYASSDATEKKILRNVFAKGDAYFSTGDVLSMDELGYMYFRDRTGDTFRWKGENVSTAEVESCMSNVLDLADCAVYGVEVPGSEGRAGMAAVAVTSTEAGVDLERLARELPAVLPAYARPLFVRQTGRLESTGTFKMVKAGLRRDGFDPARCSPDPVFYWEARAGRYGKLTDEAFEAINKGEMRF